MLWLATFGPSPIPGRLAWVDIMVATSAPNLSILDENNSIRVWKLFRTRSQLFSTSVIFAFQSENDLSSRLMRSRFLKIGFAHVVEK